MSDKKILVAKSVRNLSKWFSIALTIKLFGVTILHWVFPPLPEPTDEDIEIIEDVE